MIEFVLPNEWSEDKKNQFEVSMSEKMLKKLKPLIDQQEKDKKKEEVDNGNK